MGALQVWTVVMCGLLIVFGGVTLWAMWIGTRKPCDYCGKRHLARWLCWGQGGLE